MLPDPSPLVSLTLLADALSALVRHHDLGAEKRLELLVDRESLVLGNTCISVPDFILVRFLLCGPFVSTHYDLQACGYSRDHETRYLSAWDFCDNITVYNQTCRFHFYA